MIKNTLYIIQRLPEFYQWKQNVEGKQAELFTDSDDKLIAFRLMSEPYDSDGQLMARLSHILGEMVIDNVLISQEGEPTLFVRERDSGLVQGFLKNMGIAIAAEVSDLP